MYLKLPPELLIILVGLLGSIVHAFNQMANKKKVGATVNWKDFCIYTVYGGFAAVMFGIAAQWVFDDQLAQLFFTGMGAFMGFAGLNALSIWTLKKIGVDPENYADSY